MSHDTEPVAVLPVESDASVPEPSGPSPEHHAAFDAAGRLRDARRARMRAAVVRKQTIEAFEMVEKIDLSMLGDTAFRDKYVLAKRGLEQALEDFLLDDAHHAKRVDDALSAITPEQWTIIHQTAWV